MNTHGKTCRFPFMMDTCFRPPRSVLLLPWSHRRNHIGVAVLRTTIPVLGQTQSPQSSLLYFLILHAWYVFLVAHKRCYRMVICIRFPSHTPLFKERGGCRQRPFLPLASSVDHCYLHIQKGAQWLQPGETTKTRWAPVEEWRSFKQLFFKTLVSVM